MRLVRTVAATAVGMTLLASCSNGETANETLPPASSSAAETSESLPPLGPPDMPMPAEAREKTSAGAEAFLSYYMDLYNSAQKSMHTDYIKQFSQACQTCDRIIREIDSDALAGYAYQGGEVAIDFIDASEPTNSNVEVVFSFTQAALTVIDKSGQPVPELVFPERPSPGAGAILAWSPTDKTWILNQWDVN